jgi:hypothetical protein
MGQHTLLMHFGWLYHRDLATTMCGLQNMTVVSFVTAEEWQNVKQWLEISSESNLNAFGQNQFKICLLWTLTKLNSVTFP